MSNQKDKTIKEVDRSTVILAGQDGNLSRIFLHKGVGPMSANVVVRPDLPLAIPDKEECEASFSYPNKLTYFT